MSKIFDAVRSAEAHRETTIRLAAVAIAEPTSLSADANRSAVPERRQQRRAGVNLPVRLRPADFKDGSFEEVLTTLNACRGSFYVTTSSARYYPKMRLRIAYPYSQHDVVSVSEETGEVVRLERLQNGQTGVAVLFVTGQGQAQDNSGAGKVEASNKGAGERRTATRHPFSATAAVTESTSDTKLQGRCSDLSLQGCYVDTMNPFPDGLCVNVRLGNAPHIFEAVARIVNTHPGMGMGLVFLGLTPRQKLTLANWLDGTSARNFSVTERVVSIQQPAVLADSGSPELILKLLRLLQTKGIITQADASSLLADSHD